MAALFELSQGSNMMNFDQYFSYAPGITDGLNFVDVNVEMYGRKLHFDDVEFAAAPGSAIFLEYVKSRSMTADYNYSITQPTDPITGGPQKNVDYFIGKGYFWGYSDKYSFGMDFNPVFSTANTGAGGIWLNEYTEHTGNMYLKGVHPRSLSTFGGMMYEVYNPRSLWPHDYRFK